MNVKDPPANIYQRLADVIEELVDQDNEPWYEKMTNVHLYCDADALEDFLFWFKEFLED
jgi:hypothetical protein